MAQPFVGEIRLFAGNFAPDGWMFCEGQFLPIAENETLFQLIGTMYGGDGEETFAVPDLRGRVPIHAGTGSAYTLGEKAGVEQVVLTPNQVPAHTHALALSPLGAALGVPMGNVLADTSGNGALIYGPAGGAAALSAAALGPVGAFAPHTNLMPYLSISFIISLFGIFPQRN